MSGEGLLASARLRAIVATEEDARAVIWARLAYALASVRPIKAAVDLADAGKTLRALGCDQLDCLTIAMDLEEALGLSIPDDIITRDRTLGQCADHLFALTQGTDQ
ncbi:MAG: phosphopantetheine-binding protein [Sphingobium sp.]|uniref:phosphopantetheine-binding protein n=1 Tax=Sphingobium sp. TaxID=1912891 RepID=UPI003BAF4446